jgi:type II secretory pathway component PulM
MSVMANEWSERVRGYLAARSARERQTLMAGGLVLLVLLGYGGIYEPLSQARAKLAEHLPMQRAELRLMRVQAAEIERLRTRMGEAGKGSPEQRVKASAAAFGLVGSFKQFTPLAGGQVQLSTQPLPTAAWSGWLADLEGQGISIVRCRVSADAQPGMASLDLTLHGGQQ